MVKVALQMHNRLLLSISWVQNWKCSEFCPSSSIHLIKETKVPNISTWDPKYVITITSSSVFIAYFNNMSWMSKLWTNCNINSLLHGLRRCAITLATLHIANTLQMWTMHIDQVLCSLSYWPPFNVISISGTTIYIVKKINVNLTVRLYKWNQKDLLWSIWVPII